MNDAKTSVMLNAKTSVMVATPVRYWKGIEQFHPDFQALLSKLAELSNDETCPYEFQFATITGGIVRARNKMVGNFLAQRKANPNLKWIVFLDDDMDVQAQDIIRLLSHKQPIVGAMYTRRTDPPLWVANFMFDAVLQPNGLLQAAECGTGLKAYHWQVFTELIRLFPTIRYFERDTGQEQHGFFQQVIMNEDAPSEDYFLDYLCRQARIGVWLDTNTKIKHRDQDGKLWPQEWPPIPGITP